MNAREDAASLHEEKYHSLVEGSKGRYGKSASKVRFMVVCTLFCYHHVAELLARDTMDDPVAYTFNSCMLWSLCRSNKKTSARRENQVGQRAQAHLCPARCALNRASQESQTIFEIQQCTRSLWRAMLLA